MNALFLKDLGAKTHRGQSGRIEKGKSGGGIAYGYNVVKQFDANGEPIRGDREINEEQAQIVRRIYKEYASGMSPKKIAQKLNKDGIPCPSGKAWGPSTIYGNRRRGTGIINNELYIGQLVWNRQKFSRDPDTGKRVARLNPKEEWQITEVPHLRIVEQELWDAVKGRQKALDEKPQFWAKQRPRSLLSYLLKCGCCGGGISKVSAERYGCSASRNKGTCDNRLTIRQDQLENTILDGLKHHLMDANLIEEFCKEYTQYINELRKQRNSTRRIVEKELKKLAKDKQKIIEAIKSGIPATEVKDELERIATRRTALEEALDGTEDAPVLLHPNMAQRYQTKVEAFTAALNKGETKGEATTLLRSLIDKIVLTPKSNGMEYSIDIHGDLGGILTIAAGKQKRMSQYDPMLQQVRMITGYQSDIPEDQRELVEALSVASYKDKVVAGAGCQRCLVYSLEPMT